MRKKTVSILSIILFICLICSITYASETNVTLQKDKEKYTGGDVVEISVKVNDITLESGIQTIIGKISYNTELYENCVIEASNSWEADYNANNGKIILQRNEGIKENHTAFVVKLTIKDNIVNTDTISFTEINIADENTDLFPANATTAITIENIVPDDGEEPEEEPGETPGGEDPEQNPNETPEDKTLTGIEITEEPTKNTYKVGEKFDKTGMKVVAKYSDGSSKEITNYTIENGDKLAEGQTSIKISYTEGNVTKTVEQKVTVVGKITVEGNESDFEEIKEDDTKTEDKMPNTGAFSVLGIMLVITVFGVVCLVKYNKYKGI